VTELEQSLRDKTRARIAAHRAEEAARAGWADFIRSTEII
jgi:hypothetical protein